MEILEQDISEKLEQGHGCGRGGPCSRKNAQPSLAGVLDQCGRFMKMKAEQRCWLHIVGNSDC
jgi:hypothetical protein